MNKISPNREKKEKIVAKLYEKVEKAKGIVFADYTSMTHVQIEDLKKEVRNLETELVVSKNTLLKRALELSPLASHLSPLKGPTLTLFAYNDIVEPLKKLVKTIKLLNVPAIKFGIMDGQALNADELLKLSTLPSREVLLTQLVFGIKSPIIGLHRALNWNMQKLVLTIEQIKDQKSIRQLADKN